VAFDAVTLPKVALGEALPLVLVGTFVVLAIGTGRGSRALPARPLRLRYRRRRNPSYAPTRRRLHRPSATTIAPLQVLAVWIAVLRYRFFNVDFIAIPRRRLRCSHRRLRRHREA
jgi:hypothetical protein